MAIFLCADCGRELVVEKRTKTYLPGGGSEETIHLGACAVCLDRKQREINAVRGQLSIAEDALEQQHEVLKNAGLVASGFPCDSCDKVQDCGGLCQRRREWDAQRVEECQSGNGADC